MSDSFYDFSMVLGQEHVKRAIEITASGGHAITLIGPPGAGKTTLALALQGILPLLEPAEAAEASGVAHAGARAGAPRADGHAPTRPFRAPAHSITSSQLAGEGTRRPPETHLAHRGVLLLDDFPRYKPAALDRLTRALKIEQSLADAPHAPLDFTLVATLQPCPCGFFGSPAHTCTCSEEEIARYQRATLRHPLLEATHLEIEVPALKTDHLVSARRGETSEQVRARVADARRRQAERYARDGAPLLLNAHLPQRLIDRYCGLDEAGKGLMRSACNQLGLSAQAYRNVLVVARTIADLAGEDRLGPVHLAEALQYRPRKRG